MRDAELELLEHSEFHQNLLKKQYAETQQKLYPIIGSNPQYAITDMLSVLKADEREFDVVFFDMAGTTSTNGIISTITNLDHLFVPITADRMSLESALSFVIALNESVVAKKTTNLKSIHLFWNQVDKRESTPLYDIYEKKIDELSLDLFTSQLPERKKFKKDAIDTNGIIYRSTVFAPDKRFTKETGLDDLMGEICSILDLE